MGIGERKERYQREGCWLEFIELRQDLESAGVKRPDSGRRAEAEMEFKYFDGPDPPRYRDDTPCQDGPKARADPPEPSRVEEVNTDPVPMMEKLDWVMMQYPMAQDLKDAGTPVTAILNQLIDLEPPPPNRAAIGMMRVAMKDQDYIIDVYKMAAKTITGDGPAERMYDDGSDTREETLQQLASEASTGLGGERSLADPAEVAG